MSDADDLVPEGKIVIIGVTVAARVEAMDAGGRTRAGELGWSNVEVERSRQAGTIVRGIPKPGMSAAAPVGGMLLVGLRVLAEFGAAQLLGSRELYRVPCLRAGCGRGQNARLATRT